MFENAVFKKCSYCFHCASSILLIVKQMCYEIIKKSSKENNELNRIDQNVQMRLSFFHHQISNQLNNSYKMEPEMTKNR